MPISLRKRPGSGRNHFSFPLIRFRKMVAIKCNTPAEWPSKNFRVVTKGSSSVYALCRYGQESWSKLSCFSSSKRLSSGAKPPDFEKIHFKNILKIKPWVTPPHTMCCLMINDMHQDLLAHSLIWGRYTLMQLIKLSRNLL